VAHLDANRIGRRTDGKGEGLSSFQEIIRVYRCLGVSAAHEHGKVGMYAGHAQRLVKFPLKDPP
jgi:hypothetical protein